MPSEKRQRNRKIWIDRNRLCAYENFIKDYVYNFINTHEM